MPAFFEQSQVVGVREQLIGPGFEGWPGGQLPAALSQVAQVIEPAGRIQRRSASEENSVCAKVDRRHYIPEPEGHSRHLEDLPGLLEGCLKLLVHLASTEPPDDCPTHVGDAQMQPGPCQVIPRLWQHASFDQCPPGLTGKSLQRGLGWGH